MPNGDQYAHYAEIGNWVKAPGGEGYRTREPFNVEGVDYEWLWEGRHGAAGALTLCRMDNGDEAARVVHYDRVRQR